jgi:AcrR family transcriptional regulator
MKLKEKIISQSLLLFMKKGVRSVNMDDISSHLGISKKTLYLYVKNKPDLVFQSFNLLCQQLSQSLSTIIAEEKNAIDELYQMDEQIFFLLKSMHISIVGELKKYYLESWELIENFKKSFLLNLIETNIKKGISQNLFRQDLNSNMIAKIFINRCETLVNGELFNDSEFNLRDVLKEHRIYHVRGIASLKGVIHLEEKLNTW